MAEKPMVFADRHEQDRTILYRTIRDLEDRIEKLEAAARDALAGWRYIRETHGDLYGVGWDRVESALVAALAAERGEGER